MIWNAGFLLLLWPDVCLGLEIGWTASIENWPFVAALYVGTSPDMPFENKPFCTGTIVTKRHVLTTFGCVNKQHPFRQQQIIDSPSDIWVWVGSPVGFKDSKENVESQYVQVNVVFVPDQADLNKTFGDPEIKRNEYISGDYTYYLLDFAILHLNLDLKWNRFVQSVRFDPRYFEQAVVRYRKWKKNLDNEVDWIPDCYVAGWGSDDHNEVDEKGINIPKKNESRRQRLVYTRVKYTPKLKCDLAYCTNCSLCGNITEDYPYLYWCFTSYLWGDTCPGDQGAPIWCSWFGYKNNVGETIGAILGILSGRPGTCNQDSLPAKFSAIWYAYPMIEATINNGKFPPPALPGITDPDWF